MESQEQLPPQMDEAFPSDEDLIHLYSDIENAAREAVARGKVIGNPMLEQQDARYGISVDALTTGSVVHLFLVSVLSQIKSVEPTAVCVAPDDLHMTQGEVYFSNVGRVVQKQKVITAQSLRRYYDAIRNNLSDFDPIRLKLFRIMPTLDTQLSDTDKRWMAVVAAFLTDDDPQIHKLRRDINSSVEKEGLEAQARLGVSKVLFVSLARLSKPPKTDNNAIPLLQVIDEANRNIPPDARLTVDKIYVRSTSTISYVMPKGYVTLDPPILLNKGERSDMSPRFVRPSQFHPK